MERLARWFRREPEHTGTYRERFEDAIKRTRRFKLPVPAFETREGRLLEDRDGLATLTDALSIVFAGLSPHIVAGNCAPVTAALIGPITQALKCPAYFTFGWLNTAERGDIFKMTEADIARWLKGVLPPGHASFHCWITLGTMEIVDATIATSDAVVNGGPTDSANIIARHADELRGLRYHPMLVGDEFLDELAGLFRCRVGAQSGRACNVRCSAQCLFRACARNRLTLLRWH